jgi:hypothetical protein
VAWRVAAYPRIAGDRSPRPIAAKALASGLTIGARGIGFERHGTLKYNHTVIGLPRGVRINNRQMWATSMPFATSSWQSS